MPNYNITELAMAYFENYDPSNARKRLNRMMQKYPELWEELQQANYQPRQRCFTPKQYNLIVKYMGEP